MSSLYRSVTQGLLAIPNAQRLLSMWSTQSLLHEQLKDPLNAEACHKKTNGLVASQNLVIVDVAKGYKAIGYSAVFKKFHPVTGQYLSARARIVPHGFRQLVNQDYDPDKIAAPTLLIETLHLFSMFGFNKCRYKRARDAISAFTTVDLDELIEWPVGVPQPESKCMKLGKMCYGLKQAAWVFHDKVCKTLLEIGYQPTLFDACLHFLFVRDGDREYFVYAVYVDNFNIAAEREENTVHYDEEIEKRIDSRVEVTNIILGIVFVETAYTLRST